MKTMEVLTVVAALFAVSATGATIEGYFSGNAAATGTYNLSELGSEDWVYWDTDSSGGTPSNSRQVGNLISNAVLVGTGSLARPSTANYNTTLDFTYTDGVDPSSGTVSKPSGVFNNEFTAGNGVGVVIDLPSTKTYQITIFVSGYDAVAGTLTASLPGATDFVNAEYKDGTSSVKDSAFFTLFVTADNAGDDLTIEFIKHMNNANQYDFVILAGVAVGIAPPRGSLEGAFSGNASATGTYNLTELGSEDWVYWDRDSSGGTPSNSRQGGNLISDALLVGTGSTLGRPSTVGSTTLDFTYTDGAEDPTSGTVSKPSGVFNDAYDVVGNGVGFTVDLPTVNTYIISVFVSGASQSNDTEGRFTAVLPGGVSYVNTEFADAPPGDSDRDCAIFTLTATPGTAGDDLTVEFTLRTDPSGVNYVILAGVAVRIAPTQGTVISIR